MSELISRKLAIDALKRKQDNGKGDISRFYNTIVQHDIEAIEQLPSAQPMPKECEKCIFKPFKQFQPAQPQWIPCNERLPNNDDFVIVTIRDERGDTPWTYSDFGWYLEAAKCWIVDAEPRTDIVAWMLLPEPYKESEET